MTSWRTPRQDAEYRVREAKTQLRQIDSQVSGLQRSLNEANAKRDGWVIELEAAIVSLTNMNEGDDDDA